MKQIPHDATVVITKSGKLRLKRNKNVRDHLPKRIKCHFCTGCKQTTTYVLIDDENGIPVYECAGNPKLKVNGCGQKAYPQDPRPPEQWE